MQYKLKKDVVIPAGTIFSSGPSEIKHYVPHYEICLGFDKNSVGRFIVCEEDMKELKGYFESISELCE